jgi:hypothetical protein
MVYGVRNTKGITFYEVKFKWMWKKYSVTWIGLICLKADVIRGSCECGNDSPGFMTGRAFLDQQSDY